jgi:hypothetical protein
MNFGSGWLNKIIWKTFYTFYMNCKGVSVIMG